MILKYLRELHNKPFKFVPTTKCVASTGLTDARRLAGRESEEISHFEHHITRPIKPLATDNKGANAPLFITSLCGQSTSDD